MNILGLEEFDPFLLVRDSYKGLYDMIIQSTTRPTTVSADSVGNHIIVDGK